ncbi:MAG: hypothetical protein CM15mV100_510 [uncultured marine virus]|nr:MAG: hypothetical protein CM15mV100_510 [uncultured marine virus]
MQDILQALKIKNKSWQSRGFDAEFLKKHPSSWGIISFNWESDFKNCVKKLVG